MSEERQDRIIVEGPRWTVDLGGGARPARMRTRSEIMRARRELREYVSSVRRPITAHELRAAVESGCECWETCRVADPTSAAPAPVPELEVKRAAGGRVSVCDFRPVAIVEASPYADCWGEGR
jgi:hypothetical protein